MKINIIIFTFGFISGFILLISGNSLNFWLSAEGVDIASIGLFSIVTLPYAISFIWAPILDRVRIPMLDRIYGHRLSWIYLLQILLSISVYIVSICSPQKNLYMLSVCSILVAFLSSTQDVAIGALRSEIVKPSEQGAVSGTYVLGYRIGMLFSSSGAIFLSNIISWGLIYKIFASIILFFPIVLHFLLKISSEVSNIVPKPTERNNIFDIIDSFGGQKSFIYIILFLILYRLPDNFIHVMMNPFLLNIGFDAMEIASVGKFLGIISSIIGGFIASYIMRKRSIISSLLLFGIIHAICHLFFVIQNIVGHNILLLFFVMGFESITSGMTMASYIAFITSLCKGRYRATQYAFLTSLMGLSRSILPGFAGFFVVKYGWSAFYIFASIASIPSIYLLYRIRDKKLLKSS